MRDIALWTPSSTTPETIEKIIQENAGELLMHLSLFDTFLPAQAGKKPEKTSYAFRLVFQSMERTLTDEEVNGIMNTISLKLRENPDFQIR